MGEDAIYRGRQIKIGTCEDMYYLRAGQVDKVRPTSNSLDPRDKRVQERIRFRFPWPDEDNVEPGAFDRHDRGYGLHIDPPAEVEHGNVQFSAHEGYNLCLPCPEGAEGKEYAKTTKHGIHRNGFGGATVIYMQGWRDGKLVLIGKCGGCRFPYRYPTLADVRPVLDELRKKSESRYETGNADWLLKVAERIMLGYEGKAV